MRRALENLADRAVDELCYLAADTLVLILQIANHPQRWRKTIFRAR